MTAEEYRLKRLATRRDRLIAFNAQFVGPRRPRGRRRSDGDTATPKPAKVSTRVPKIPKAPTRTLAEYKAHRKAQAAATAQAQAEARAAAKAVRALQKAEREQAKAEAARQFKRSFVGPPKPKGYRPPPRILSEAEQAAKVQREQSTIARQEAHAAYLSDMRKAEQARYDSLAAPRPVRAAPKPPTPIDLSLIAEASALVLERRRKALEAMSAITALRPTNKPPSTNQP